MKLKYVMAGIVGMFIFMSAGIVRKTPRQGIEASPTASPHWVRAGNSSNLLLLKSVYADSLEPGVTHFVFAHGLTGQPTVASTRYCAHRTSQYSFYYFTDPQYGFTIAIDTHYEDMLNLVCASPRYKT